MTAVLALRHTSERTASDPTPAPGISVRGLTLGYRAEPIVRELDVEIPGGQVTAIIGPNGCGKSTLLRGLGRLLPARAGEVRLGGRGVTAYGSKELAKVLGLLPQSPVVPEGVRVRELVERGRHPYRGMFSRWSAQDEHAVTEALEQTDTAGLADALVDELSGGQRQRVWIAMVLAQNTRVLLLDEPTSFLDLAHQVEVLDLVRSLNRTRGTTVVMVLHDLGMAARYADHVIGMSRGRVVAVGDPVQVVTPQTVREVFGIDCRVITDPGTGTPVVLPGSGQPQENGERR